MKHIKIYEKVNKQYWIVCVEFPYDPERNYHELYEDEQSAKNKVIDVVNNESKDILNDDYKIITDLNEAEELIDNVLDGINVYYYKIFIEDKFDLPEYIVLAKKAKKYNI